MKKSIKITLLVIAIAVFIFLMLPFIFPSSETENAAQRAAADAVTPQIFTSNPLAKLVNRLARFFGRQPAPRSAVAANATQPLTDALYADARAAGDSSANADVTDMENDPEAIAQAFENAALQNEEGEWVLIRQQAPEGSASGMHEVNVKENAYDRYVKQQRAAQYTPSSSKVKNKVPDSKWARMFRPIKRLFGMDDTASPASTTLQIDGRANSSSGGGSAEGPLRTLNSSSGRSGGAAGAGTMGSAYFRHPAADLLAMIDPNRAARNAADMIADGAFPNPQNPDEAAQKDELRQQAQGNVLSNLSKKLSEQLIRTAQGQQPEDKLQETFSCGAKALTSTATDKPCGPGGENTPASPSSIDVEIVRNKNKELFLERTKYNMPPAPLTVVLSKADATPQQDLLDYKAGEIYAYMLENTDCSSQSCFWVANATQTTPDLKETVEASGATFKGDPLGKYDQIKQGFTEQKMANLPEDASEKDREEARTQADRFATPYVLYTTQDILTLQQNDKNFVAGRGNADQVTALYFSKAADAQQFMKESGEPPLFFYGKDGAVVDADNGSTIDRSAQLTNDMADLIIFAKQEFQQATSQAGKQAISSQMGPRMKELMQALEQQKKAFDQRNGARK